MKLACSVVFGVVVIACGANRLMAQDTKAPSTQPAEPAGQDLDPATPKGALRAFAKATRGADFPTLERVSKTDTEDELEGTLIAAANNYQKSMGDLFSAVRDKFGDNEVRKFMRQRGAIPLEPFLRLIEAELDDHDVVVQGDTARLVDRRDPTTETHIKLVRENGVWKVVSSGLVAQFGTEAAQQRVQMLTVRAQIVSAVAEEVAAEKYDSIDAVGEGLRDALRR